MNNQILFKCIRGSHAYGLATEQSDIDTTGIFIKTADELYGLKQTEYIADEKNDNTLYEIGRVIELLIAGNPSMLEMLFIPDSCVQYKHPSINVLFANREQFLTKQVLNSLSGYARSQIYKARGLNKKIVNPIVIKKTPIDFCYTFNDAQGTELISEWLSEHRLKQKYCGLNHMPNMNQMYGVFYDWQQHLKMEFTSGWDFAAKFNSHENNKWYSDILNSFFPKWNPEQDYEEYLCEVWEHAVPIGYHGIQKEAGTSNDVHLDPILKGDIPICYLSYNKDGYSTHCRQYKEYKDWEKKRNPARYESNLMKNYDAKNIMHCIRLLIMACELAETGKFNIDRANIDRQYLLDIKNHKYEYDEILKITDSLMKRLEEAKKMTILPETVDLQFANKLLISIRKDYYRNNH